MLRVHVTGTERRFDVVAAVEDRSEWRMFLPFPQHRIRHAALVSSDRIVCLSDEAEICLIDFRLEKEVARRDISPVRQYRILVTSDNEFIIIYCAKSYFDDFVYYHDVHILRAADLTTVIHGNAIQLQAGGSIGRIVDRSTGETHGAGSSDLIDLQILGEIFEDSVGRPTFVCSSCGPTGSQHGLCRIDRSDWSVHFTPIPNGVMPWRWFSPSGRYALAPHIGGPFARHLERYVTWASALASRIEASFAQSASAVRVSNQKAISERRYEGYQRHRGGLELWTTAPAKLVGLIGTRTGMTPEFVHDVVWEPTETSFWVKFEGNSRRIEFQRVSVDGSQSPVFSFQRFHDRSFSLQDIVDLADSRHAEVRVFSDSTYIQRDWCKSELQFRLIAENEDGFRKNTFPYPPDNAVKRFLAKAERQYVVLVQEFSTTAITVALQNLACDVRERLADLLQGDVFELSFKIGKRKVTEAAFFKQITQERIPVASALRHLLTAYLEVQPAVVEAKELFRQIWGPENQGALAPAMQALLLLDPNAHDVFREYLARRDGEHETHSTDVIMKRYIRANGWRDTAMIGFGIYFALIRQRDGRTAIQGGLLNEYGLLSAAERMMDADQLAALISQETDQFVANPGLDRGSAEDLYLALQTSLEMTGYGRRVLTALSSRTGLILTPSAEERGWNRDLLHAVKQQQAHEQDVAGSWWSRLFRKSAQ